MTRISTYRSDKEIEKVDSGELETAIVFRETPSMHNIGHSTLCPLWSTMEEIAEMRTRRKPSSKNVHTYSVGEGTLHRARLRHISGKLKWRDRQ